MGDIGLCHRSITWIVFRYLNATEPKKLSFVILKNESTGTKIVVLLMYFPKFLYDVPLRYCY
jgi:hypothetical protein